MGKPKINVEGDVYCYRCSKNEVKARQTTRRDAAEVQHRRAIGIYDEAKKRFDRILHEWAERRNKYVDAGPAGWTLGIVGVIGSYFFAEDIKRGIGILGIVLALIGWGIIAARYRNKKDAEFRAIDPEPIFGHSYPSRPNVNPVSHAPHMHDGSPPLMGDFREHILRRDGLICQICGKKKQRKNLEVHHIIPRAKGGTDNPTNLVTLCKHCHDREDWYEHSRAYPTTIKIPVRRKWRRWHRSR